MFHHLQFLYLLSFCGPVLLEHIELSTEASPGWFDEGCRGEEEKLVVFEMKQIVALGRCAQLNRDECMNLHEARLKCPCICHNRERYHSPYGQQRHGAIFTTTRWTPFPEDKIAGIKGIDPTRRPAVPGRRPPLICFSGDDRVTTPDGSMTMSQLFFSTADNQDIQVLSWNRDTNKVRYASVKLWLHGEPSRREEFMVITTADTHQLSITDNHLIYRLSAAHQQVETVLAGKISTGDYLFISNGNSTRPKVVVKIERKTKTGTFAPITTMGSIIVNDIAASCYVHNENEQLLQFVFGYFFAVRDLLKCWLPEWIFERVFPRIRGATQLKVPSVFLELEHLKDWVLV